MDLRMISVRRWRCWACVHHDDDNHGQQRWFINDYERALLNEKLTEADVRNRARARTDLAGGYYRNGQLAVALDEARRAVAIDANYAEAYGLLGLIYMDMKEQRDAEENFQRALKLDAAQLRAQ